MATDSCWTYTDMLKTIVSPQMDEERVTVLQKDGATPNFQAVLHEKRPSSWREADRLFCFIATFT